MAAHTDLAWWQIMLDSWLSTSIHQFLLLLKEPSCHFFSNASTSLGWGAFSLPAWLSLHPQGRTYFISSHSKALYDCTRMSSLGTPVDRNICPLHSDNVGAVCQSPFCSGPNCSPPLALLGTLYETVRLLYSGSSYCRKHEHWC